MQRAAPLLLVLLALVAVLVLASGAWDEPALERPRGALAAESARRAPARFDRRDVELALAPRAPDGAAPGAEASSSAPSTSSSQAPAAPGDEAPRPGSLQDLIQVLIEERVERAGG